VPQCELILRSHSLRPDTGRRSKGATPGGSSSAWPFEPASAPLPCTLATNPGRAGHRCLIISGPIFGLVGANIVASQSWLIRSLLGAIAGLAGALIAAMGVAGFYAVLAPRKQRDEARSYARALEAHMRDYAEWARRLEIAEDFRRETLEFARSVSEGNWHQPAAVLEEHWRSNAATIRAQLSAHGSGDGPMAEIDRQLEALESKRRRVWRRPDRANREQHAGPRARTFGQ
jgi:hypothetical protein